MFWVPWVPNSENPKHPTGTQRTQNFPIASPRNSTNSRHPTGTQNKIKTPRASHRNSEIMVMYRVRDRLQVGSSNPIPHREPNFWIPWVPNLNLKKQVCFKWTQHNVLSSLSSELREFETSHRNPGNSETTQSIRRNSEKPETFEGTQNNFKTTQSIPQKLKNHYNVSHQKGFKPQSAELYRILCNP